MKIVWDNLAQSNWSLEITCPNDYVACICVECRDPRHSSTYSWAETNEWRYCEGCRGLGHRACIRWYPPLYLCSDCAGIT